MSVTFDLKEKVALITGGSRGLGRAMALAFAEHGADLVIASRKADRCKELAAEIADTTGRQALGIGFHAGQWEEPGRLLDQIYDRFGRLDVLVNNAGMSPLYPKLSEIDEELFDKVLSVNFKGPFRLSVLAGERMAENEGGSIINISSIAALEPGPTELPYASAKAALTTMTVGLARAFGPTVRANVIMPGYFLTDVSKSWDDATLRSIEAKTTADRAGQPAEIVGAALFLASSASSYTTGAVIKVDGGAVYATS